jgi:hypothetical protein
MGVTEVFPGVTPAPRKRGFSLSSGGNQLAGRRQKEGGRMSILWIILIVILVLALLGFFSRGRW